MCARCREKFLREKRQALKDKSKKAKKKVTPGKTPQSVTSILEPHLVMKKNAMFLLDLASATGIILPTQAAFGKQGLRLDNVLPSVSEDSLGEHCPFPAVPFLYLVQRGAHAADSAFAEDVIFKSDEFVPTFIENHRHSGDLSNLPRVTRSDSMGSREHRRSTHLTPQEETNPEPGFPSVRSAAASPENDSVSPASGRSIIFQRSISEMAGGARQDQVESSEENVNNKVVVRRRNNSGGIADGGMSLLKHPSAPMSKLIQSAEKLAVRLSASDKSLQRPVMSFVIQRHDLDSLQLAMRQALRKAACRVFALQAFNWLVRSVTQPTCLHDLLWFFVASLAPCTTEWDEEEPDVDNKKERKDHEQEKDQSMCEHPLSDITIGGEAVHPLPKTFHTFLQTISDVMMYLPPGSALQQMAVCCWCLKFRPADHVFLHKSHVFSNISKILSKSDEEWGEPTNTNENLQQVYGSVECLKDLTPLAELKASSRQAMIVSLTDNSTETFWESGDEDRNKTKSIIVTASTQHSPKMVYVHIDNSRDLGNKVSSVAFTAGPSLDELRKLRQVEVEARHTGWVSCPIREPHFSVIRLELKGPDNSLRLRQVKVLGEVEGVSLIVSGAQHSPLVMQQKDCEAETLKVFRLLTSQVFGRLIVDESSCPDQKDKKNEGDLDLKEHMVGILFSRSKLTHLQKQVCSHIVQAIRKESQRVQDEWEAALSSNSRHVDEHNRSCDAYCFELLSMVLALSGSGVGRAFLAQQHSLIQNLLSLLHTATPRVQRQVTALLRRVLPEVSPLTLANLLLVPALPPKDFSILSSTDKAHSPSLTFDPNRPGVLDVFLACIAKALTVQTKVKGQAGAKGGSFRLTDSLPPSMRLPGRWWLRGSISSKQAESIITLLKDMTEGKLSEAWAAVTKGAIAEAILALTKLDEKLRDPNECVKTPTLWLALASLCVLGQEHVERLSSGQWVGGSEPNTPRPTCDNHDDGETSAIILCSECGNLCADCDRFLHLHRRTRSHQRQVFKEEEEAIKVDRHEGCGRTKLFWLMALADSKTLKAMVEFREGNKGKVRGSSLGTCRFCGTSDNTGILAIGNVCSDTECQRHAANACTKVLSCGHPCGGIAGEEQCLLCLQGCLGGDGRLKQDADDMCMVCFTEALAAAPAIQLACGHVFHLHCCKNVLAKGWVGPRITFGFSLCPICKNQIRHTALRDGLESISRLYEDVHRKALMRLEYEGLHKAEAITTIGARFYEDPAGYAMERYAYYVCYKCNKAYYGGEVRCEEQAVQADQYDPAELVCGACSDVSRAQMCPKHGTDFLEYKCRYCCSVAVFFCFGTTHFCNVCHDDFQRVTNLPKADLPHCPAGPKAKQLEGEECPLHVQHPPTGEEFALGCGVCRNAHTF